MTGPSRDDEELLAELRAGDRPAAEMLLSWARAQVRLGPYTIPRDEQEDLAQTAVAQVWNLVSAPDFQLRVGLRALIRRVTVARCIDWMRVRRQTTEVDDQTPDGRPDPFEDLLRQDRVALLRTALDRLDEPCQEILRLRYLEDRPYEEIATRLERAASTLRVRVFHCIKKLRAWMAQYD